MSINLKNFLELYVPKAGDERKFVAKHVVKKTPDANKNDDKLFTASNVKAIDRKKDNHGYNPGDDEKVYEEVEQIVEMDARTAKELATKSMKQGQSKKATMYNKVAAALERGDNTTAKGFLQQINNLDEASLTPGEMKKREDYVKGMKKNISSFKDRYGKDAKSVMYATATKMAKEEVEQIDEISKETLASYIPKASKSARFSGMIGQDMQNRSDRARSKGMKDSYQRISMKYKKKAWDREDNIAKAAQKLAKEQVEELDELSTDTLRSYRSKAIDDMKKNTNAAKITGYFDKDYEAADQYYAKAEKRRQGFNAAGKKLAVRGQVAHGYTKEDVDSLLLLSLYMSLDEDNQQEMLKMIDEGNKPELIEFAQSIME